MSNEDGTEPLNSGEDQTSETSTTEPTSTETQEPETGGGAEEVAKWKALAREQEKRAKANFAELKKLQQQSMTDQEKAIDEARTAARDEAVRDFGGRLVASQVKVALAGRDDVDVDALLAPVDLAKFLGEDGEVDSTAVTAWVSAVAPPKPSGLPDLGQGVRTGANAALNGDPLLNDLKLKLGIR